MHLQKHFFAKEWKKGRPKNFKNKKLQGSENTIWVMLAEINWERSGTATKNNDQWNGGFQRSFLHQGITLTPTLN